MILWLSLLVVLALLNDYWRLVHFLAAWYTWWVLTVVLALLLERLWMNMLLELLEPQQKCHSHHCHFEGQFFFFCLFWWLFLAVHFLTRYLSIRTPLRIHYVDILRQPLLILAYLCWNVVQIYKIINFIRVLFIYYLKVL